MLRYLFLTLLGTTLLFGYQKGDRVSANIIQKLHLQKEKIYIIDFFASWCHSCKKELPLLLKAYADVNHTKVELIGIDVDEDITKAKKFQQTFDLNFSVINDPKGEIIEVFNPVGIPALYFIKAHKVRAMLLGAQDHIDQKITHILKELE